MGDTVNRETIVVIEVHFPDSDGEGHGRRITAWYDGDCADGATEYDAMINVIRKRHKAAIENAQDEVRRLLRRD